MASCAPLLGFEPADCVVAFVHGVPARGGPVLVRMDLGSGAEAPGRAHGLARGIAGTGGVGVDLVAFVTAADEVPVTSLPSGAMVAALLTELAGMDLGVGACLSTNGRTWWSHMCAEGCCDYGEPLDESVLTLVRAEYAFAGFAPVASRDEVAARVHPDPAAQALVAEARRRSRPAAATEPWRDRQVRDLDRLLVPAGRPDGAPRRGGSSTLTPARVARVLRGLADIRVRDTLLLRLIRADLPDPGAWARTLEVLCQLVRESPPGVVAPPATLLAIVAWLRGEGALANAALDRSDADDPEYRLAALTRQMMVNGLDPAAWRSAMAGLTESECRGRGPGGG